jgi:hypothetical protein
LGALADTFFEDTSNAIHIQPMKNYEEYLEGERALNMLQQSAQGMDFMSSLTGGPPGGNTLSKDKALLNALQSQAASIISGRPIQKYHDTNTTQQVSN